MSHDDIRQERDIPGIFRDLIQTYGPTPDQLRIEIAEDVETVEQANFLQRQGCSEMQGFYFCKHLPVGEFEQLNARSAVSPESH